MPNNGNKVDHWIMFVLQGVVDGLIRMRSPYTISPDIGSVRYLYQSGHQRQSSSLFFVSSGWRSKNIHQYLPFVAYYLFTRKVDSISTWMRYHLYLIVPSGLYCIKIGYQTSLYPWPNYGHWQLCCHILCQVLTHESPRIVKQQMVEGNSMYVHNFPSWF